jgi:hypothetical protein
MAVDYLPASWITGTVVSDGTYLQIPWSSLSASVTTETDIRNILRDISLAVEATYDALVAAALPETIPTKFTPSTNTRYNESSAEFEEKHGTLFDLTVDSTSLASE